MAELRPSIAAIRQTGADLAVIGTGDIAAARTFRKETGIGDVPVYTDEARRAYDAAGFHRGTWTLLRVRAVWNYVGIGPAASKAMRSSRAGSWWSIRLVRFFSAMPTNSAGIMPQ